MLRQGILLIFLLPVAELCAQDSAVIRQLSGCDVAFRNNATLGGQNAAIEYPRHSGKKALNRLGFWVTGVTSAGDTLVMADDVFSNKSSWHFGPVSESGTAFHLTFNDWAHFYEVNESEVMNHISHYGDKGYVTPGGILYWPSAFTKSRFRKVMAPFADVDQNGVYESNKGDFPYIPGDSNIFTMASDSSGVLVSSNTKIRFDRSVLWFTSEQQGAPENTLFFRVTLCNRDTATISGVKLSLVPDFAIGNPTDNFIATDVEYNTVLGYNSQGGDIVYGSNWPAVAVGWLSRKATSSIYFENSADGVVGKPVFKRDYYNLSNGNWKTGKFLSFGSSGVDGTVPAKFVYSNGSDPAQAFQDWDELQGSQGRRTAVLSAGGWELVGSSCVVADGYVSIIASAPDSATRRTFVAAVNNFYQNRDWSVGVKVPKTNNQTLLFPNPINAGAWFNFSQVNAKPSDVYDISGKPCTFELRENNQMRVDSSPGIYIVRFSNGIARQIILN